jgi:O-antigen/teichoic acid export membrane protein
MGVGVTKVVAVERDHRRWDQLSKAIWVSWTLPLATGLVLCLSSALLSPIIAPALINSSDAWLVLIAAASLPAVALQLPLQHVLQGLEDAVGQTIAYVLYGVGFTILAVGGAEVAGLSGAVLGLTLGNWLLVALYFLRTGTVVNQLGIVLRQRRFVRPRELLADQLTKVLLRIGAASLLVTTTFGLADLLVRTTVLKEAGEFQAGIWFGLNIISIQFIGALAGAIAFLVPSLVARSASGDDASRVNEIVDSAWRLTLLVIVPIVCLISALRDPTVRFFFSEDFASVSSHLPEQMVGDTLRSLAWAAGTALVPLGLTRWWTTIAVGSSVLFAAIGATLVASTGVSGAVDAWVLMWAVSLICTVVVLVSRRAWHPSRRAILGTAMVVPMLAAGAAFPGLTGAGLVALSTALLTRTVLTPEERRASIDWLRLRARSARRQS